MAGGVGTIGGTIVGAFVIGVINDGMVMCGVSEFWQMVIKGLVIIVAVIIDQFQRKMQAKMALQARNENKYYRRYQVKTEIILRNVDMENRFMSTFLKR